MAVGQGLQGVQVAGIARQVDGDDRLGLGRDPPLDVGHVEVVGARAQVGEDRHGLLVDDADHGADVGDRAR